jgi:outer membrane protein
VTFATQACLRSVIATALASIASALCAAPLTAFVECARSFDSGYAAARADYEARMANSQQLRAQLLPRAEFTSSVNATNGEFETRGESTDRRFQTYEVGARLVQPIFNAGALISNHQAAIQSRIAEHSLSTEKQALVTRVSSAYLDVLSATEQLDVVSAEISSSQMQFDQTDAKYKEGLRSSADVLAVQLRLRFLQLNASRQEAEIGSKKLILSALCPRNISPDGSIYDELERGDGGWSLEALVQTLKEKNPELLKLQQAVEFAQLEVKRAEKQHAPVLNGVLSVNWQKHPRGVIDTPYERNVRSAAAGLQLTVPLYSGGVTEYKTREAMALHDKAAALLGQREQELEAQLRADFLRLQAAKRDLLAGRSALGVATSAHEANLLGYVNGVRLLSDVLAAQTQVAEAKQRILFTRQLLAKSVLSIWNAQGLLAELGDMEAGPLQSSWPVERQP